MTTRILRNHLRTCPRTSAVLLSFAGLVFAGLPDPHAAKVIPRAPQTIAAGSVVERIVVQSGAWVLNPFAPSQDIVIITRDGKGYQSAGLSWDRQRAEAFSAAVDAGVVERLASALRAQDQPAFTFAGLGTQGPIALRSLQASIRDGLADKSSAGYSPRQKALLHSAEDNPRQIEAAISRSRVITHTDDYPSLSVTVTLDNSDSIEATSHSQHLYMLPWEIKGHGETWNIAIAEALHDLLPKAFQARERLTYDEGSLSEMFDSGMSEQLGEAGAEDAAGNAVTALRSVFVVKTAAMYGSLGNTDFSPNAPRDLVAALAMPDSSPNLVMRFRVTVVHGKARNLDTEIARAKAVFERVKSVPFLAAQMRIHREDTFTVNYWYGTSLHPADMVVSGDETNAFERYMRDVKGIVLTKPQLDDAGLVQQEEGKYASQWVVLPDGRVVLWRTFAPGDSAANLKSCGIQRDAADLMADAYRCVGLIFESNGELVQ